MGSDNANVTAPPGAPTLTPTKASGKWRNLIIVGAITAVGAASGWVGFGVGFNYENLWTQSGSLATRNESQGYIPIVVHETSPGQFAAGGSGDILTFFTRDGTLVIESGALLIGPNGSANIVLSGSTLSGAKLALTPTSGSAGLSIYGGVKGSHLCIRDTDGAGWSECDALNGTFTCRISQSGGCP